MWETANVKIDRFGFDRMDREMKDQLCDDWCDCLAPYELVKVQQAINAVLKEAKGQLRSINEFQVVAAIEKIDAAIIAGLPKGDDPNPSELTEDEMAARRRNANDVLSKTYPHLVVRNSKPDLEPEFIKAQSEFEKTGKVG